MRGGGLHRESVARASAIVSKLGVCLLAGDGDGDGDELQTLTLLTLLL